MLIAAHDEAHSIVATLVALKAQYRKPDRIVVAADNCTDDTVALARQVGGVTVFETKDNAHRKSGALNQAWRRFAQRAEIVVSLDADTILDPTAIGDWEAEFHANPVLGGCGSKATFLTNDTMTWREKLLVRLQRSEFAKWNDIALRRGRGTNVLAGTACALNNDALKEVMQRTGRHAPWSTTSMVEDFELTYRIRELGWQAKISATVRAYTDGMTNLRSLWAQRMKWQTGTVEDLMQFGLNKRTRFDWWQQLQGLLVIGMRLGWVALVAVAVFYGVWRWQPLFFVPPAVFVANEVKQARRIPLADRGDIAVAALMIPNELFGYMRAGWFTASWTKVLVRRIFGIAYADGWDRQARAESTRSIYAKP
ncbi:MAG TPA: glycosyltransferase family 2 protein [Acidimicrobiales bacterium]|nr:glycosyltransferase family 2 protein [Acidimicrobiales bacterium]